ncbi:alginate lyase family protein [Terriglobus tenax]|uniref:alginate lyase family protein n=1 Tax=Terriglobus tenax TaxID=1111115 RepID=UPI0021DFBFF1|nr:alginate lyase family protein [Terriglobus tenax]
MSKQTIEVSRRIFCTGAAAALLELPAARLRAQHATSGYDLVARTDRQRILTAAKKYLPLQPATITAFPSPKTPGGPHDFFSEADYFWPNPANPDGPYVNRDGQSNPNNFNGHRKAMIALSIQMPALTSAWLLTGDKRYATHAANHLRAWFITPETRMNTNLEFSQGVHGVTTGRNYGIIDTLHLVEVARAAAHIAPQMNAAEREALFTWFREYLHWLKTSEKGIAEKKTLNNHAVCWALQAAEFARLIGDQQTRREVAEQYKTIFIPDQLGTDGSFPKELARTKPYSYSIFNFDVAAMLCQSLKDSGDNLFDFNLQDGRGICKASQFLYPYLKDKSAWPYKKDVEHFDALPVRSPGLLFCGLSCSRPEYLALWKTLNPDPVDAEIIRNYPVRQPLLWFPEHTRHKS